MRISHTTWMDLQLQLRDRVQLRRSLLVRQSGFALLVSMLRQQIALSAN